jgi:hypothetical protein
MVMQRLEMFLRLLYRHDATILEFTKLPISKGSIFWWSEMDSFEMHYG